MKHVTIYHCKYCGNKVSSAGRPLAGYCGMCGHKFKGFKAWSHRQFMRIYRIGYSINTTFEDIPDERSELLMSMSTRIFEAAICISVILLAIYALSPH